MLARQGQLERAQGVIDELESQLAWHPNNAALRAYYEREGYVHTGDADRARDPLARYEKRVEGGGA